MKINNQRYHFIVILSSTIILIQLNNCCGNNNWPNWYNFFNITEINFNSDNNSFLIPVQLSKFENLLISIKNKSNIKQSTISKKITQSMESISNELNNWMKNLPFKSVSNKIPSTIKNIGNKIYDNGQNIINNIQTTSKNLINFTNKIGNEIGEVLNYFKPEIRAIFPGTHWCGDGDIAKSDKDLGLFESTDACCRQHDKCLFNIEANKRFDQLINVGIFTKSACFCDREFYNCLKNANNPLAMSIGQTYFTLLSPQCIGYDYPIVSCTQHGGLLNDKCMKLNWDNSKNKTLQWYSSPDY